MSVQLVSSADSMHLQMCVIIFYIHKTVARCHCQFFFNCHLQLSSRQGWLYVGLFEMLKRHHTKTRLQSCENLIFSGIIILDPFWLCRVGRPQGVLQQQG